MSAILQLYSLETFFPDLINRASREKDESKIDSLGPFVLLLRSVVNGAQEERKDFQASQGMITTYRATKLDQAALKVYQ